MVLPRVRVVGNHLEAPLGTPMNLRGVVLDALVADVNYYYGFWDNTSPIDDPYISGRKLTVLEAFFYRIKNLGANCIGIGMYYGYWLDRTEISPGVPRYTRYRQAIDNFVAACYKFDLYFYFRAHFSGSPYPDIQHVLQCGVDYHGDNSPIFISEAANARDEWANYYLAPLASRYSDYETATASNFIGITLFNEPPQVGESGYIGENGSIVFTWDIYKAVYLMGANAMWAANPNAIAIFPAWNVSFNQQYSPGQYVYPLPETYGKPAMYYYHFYSFFCWRARDNYPFISYYDRGSTIANTPAAKAKMEESFYDGIFGVGKFMERGGCPIQDETAWYSEAQEDPYKVVIGKFNKPGWFYCNEGGLNWYYLMKHFFELHNEHNVSWVYFDAFGRYTSEIPNPNTIELVSKQGYGLFENWEGSESGRFSWMMTRQGYITAKSVLLPQLLGGAVPPPPGWELVLDTSFEYPPVEAKQYFFTGDPRTEGPIAGWTENDVGDGETMGGDLFVKNIDVDPGTRVRTGKQSMYSDLPSGMAWGAEIYFKPSARGLLINAWIFYPVGTNFDRQMIWFQNANAQNLQWLRIRPKSNGLEIAGDSKLPGYPGETVPVIIPKGEWFNIEAWMIMSGSQEDGGVQTILEAGVRVDINDGNGLVEVWRKTSFPIPSIDNSPPPPEGVGYGYMNAVEIGPWGLSDKGRTESYVDDVKIYEYVSGAPPPPPKYHIITVNSNLQGIPFTLRRVL